LAYAVGLTDTQAQTNKVKIAVLSTKSLVSPRLLDPNPRIALRTAFYYDGLRFTPDGKAVAYGVTENGASNIWVQPLDGSAGHLITNFKTEEILAFRWSPDGKSLGILRGHSESDVVLLHESKP
jgi:Tol biopolymer transport system component